MIWVTWRQQRTETLIAALLLALVAAVLVPTGLHMASVYDGDGIAACLAHPTTGGCTETINSFARRWDLLVNLTTWFNLVPCLIGALLAAPFVLEFEHGTFRLAWTQSLSRNRWLGTRLALLVLAALAASLVFTLLMTWWRGPLDQVNGRMPTGFELEGLAPSAYTLFAVALVIAFGVVLRRTGAAVGLALVVFFAVRLAIEALARHRYQPGIHQTWVSGTEPRDAWVLSEVRELRRVGDGQAPDPELVNSCLEAGSKNFDNACLAELDIVHYTNAVYHPASRFWLFQGIEASILVGLTIVLLAFAIWWIRKRIS